MSSHFCLRGLRTNRTLIRGSRRTIFADNLAQLKSTFIKYGQAKITWSNFSVRCCWSFQIQSGSKNAVVRTADGQKECNSSPQIRFTALARREAAHQDAKHYSLPRSSRNSR